MSNDSQPSSAAPTRHEPTHSNTTAPVEATTSRSRGRRRTKKSRKSKKPDAGLKKKLEHVTHLLKTLDFVVFAELSSLYYMEYVNVIASQPPLAIPYRRICERLANKVRAGAPCFGFYCAASDIPCY